MTWAEAPPNVPFLLRVFASVELAVSTWFFSPKDSAPSGSARLVEKHGAVEGVALDGPEAGVTDDAAEFFFCCAVAGAGGLDHVLFEHDGTYVVSAEVEAEF